MEITDEYWRSERCGLRVAIARALAMNPEVILFYEKLFDWTDEHKFKTGKYSYKEAVIDELATASPSEYLTKISIQVF